MEIVKHGNRPRHTVVCPDCGCEFIVGDGELFIEIIGSTMSHFINCPECRTRVDVEESEVPVMSLEGAAERMPPHVSQRRAAGH